MATADVISLAGKSGGKANLPSELFGQDVNEKLLAQAVRVHNWRAKLAKTAGGKAKTRSEVTMTTAKWYRQKGTGRARHGSKSAPLFVGGGIAHGPTGVKRNLVLPKKVARLALFQALSAALKDKKLVVIDADKADGKTKTIFNFFEKLGILNRRVVILHGNEQDFVRAARNVRGVSLIWANKTTAYDVLSGQRVVLTNRGLELLVKTFGKKK